MPTESPIDWNARIAAIVAPPSRCPGCFPGDYTVTSSATCPECTRKIREQHQQTQKAS